MGKYYIAFDTKELKPAIKAVTIEMKHEAVLDMNKTMRIDLCDDPLYPQLVEYVRANPPRRRR